MKLPLLLSGPILRRSDPKGIIIWLATSRPFTVEGQLFQLTKLNLKQETVDQGEAIDQEAYSYTLLNVQSSKRSCRLGDSLYIYLIEIKPRHSRLPVNHLLGYNLTFKTETDHFDLGDLGLLSPESKDSIVYEPFKLPTFILKEQQTNVLYGSCRKFHGKGQDLLPEADTHLNKNAESLTERPNALFLIGDQIYADDVAACIRPFLTHLGEALIGDRQEQLDKLDPRLNLDPFQRAYKKINGRQFIINELASFTSQHAYNHLMTFGEFAAMYVMNWSPNLWETLNEEGGIPTFKEMKKTAGLYLSFPEGDKTFQRRSKTELKQVQHLYMDQLTEVKHFSKGLPAVRRLLANVPTYMIFDDHDITDDWNLSDKWAKNVRASSLGSHIITNGLTAYWAFQGWGNNPEVFHPSFIHKLESYLNTLDVTCYAHETWQAEILNFKDWAFVAPTEPKSLFLDTRTMRGYDPIPQPVQIAKNTFELPMNAELIGTKGWAKTEATLFQSGWKKEQPLLIISATPLFGMELIENFVLKYISPLRSFGFPANNRFDIEAWKDNGKGFTKFLERLQEWNPSDCFILSGDVHYGFQAKATIDYKDPNHRSPKTYYQLTSSPIKNMSFFGFFGFIVKLATYLYSVSKKRTQTNHSCDKSYHLIAKKQLINDPESINWHEQIDYKRLRRGRIMETTNNIGLLQLLTSETRPIGSPPPLDWTNTLY